MAARSKKGSAKGLYLAAKGGHNSESHNHNDVGNFIVYMDGRPMIIDVGVETYTRKTFSSKRYEIWTMQSQYHNLPTINGVMQQAGRNFAAKNVSYTSSNEYAQLKLDISGAYPPEAGVNSWVRTIRLNREENVEIVDAYQLAQVAQELTTSLVTPCEVTVNAHGQLVLRELKADPVVSLCVYYDADKMTATKENMPLKDSKLKSVWGDHVTRILLRADAPPLRDTWTLRITP